MNFVLFALIAGFGLIAGLPTTADTITEREVTHPYQKCHGKTNVKNKFSARISDVKSGESYQGTLLMVPGGHQDTWIGSYASGEKEGQKRLINDLYDVGFRILEIKWKYSVTSDTIYEDAYSCSMYGLAQALTILRDEDIGTSSDPWWPAAQSDRFAFGTSSGQISISFAVDKWTSADTKMNRVVYGGGGTSYDLFGIIDCSSPEFSNEKPLELVDYLYDGASAKCTGDATCDGDTALAAALDEASLKNYIGTGSDDASRITKVLFNTGDDWGCNHDLNEDYYNDRLGTAGTDKELWDLEDGWCSADPDPWGHYIINTVYDLRSGANEDVDEWFDFIDAGTYNSGDVDCP